MSTPEGTRFAIDAVTALRVIRECPGIADRHPLVGPAVLRSHVLSLIHTNVRAGGVSERDAKAQLDTLAGLRIRLLGDRMSRGTAFRLARRFDWEDTSPAEYLAVAALQADAIVAVDPTIVAVADQVTRLATWDDLRA